MTTRTWLRSLQCPRPQTRPQLLQLQHQLPQTGGIVPHRPRRSNVEATATAEWSSAGANISPGTSGTSPIHTRSRFETLLTSISTLQKAHWRATIHLPLRQAILSSRQSSPACSDRPCRQTGSERAHDAGAHLSSRFNDRCQQRRSVPWKKGGRRSRCCYSCKPKRVCWLGRLHPHHVHQAGGSAHILYHPSAAGHKYRLRRRQWSHLPPPVGSLSQSARFHSSFLS